MTNSLHLNLVHCSSINFTPFEFISLHSVPDDLGPEQKRGDDDEEGGEGGEENLQTIIIMMMIPMMMMMIIMLIIIGDKDRQKNL